MCAICGIVYQDPGRSVHQSELVRMRDRMAHRGPDDSGLYVHRNVGIAHRRLSIIDVGGGHQPISNEDETLWIVFNGEVYNYLELREFLLKKGHRFKTHSDTETIIHLYEELGPACVERLNGMFAFALWDIKQQRLFLARDRMGVKPLYYWMGNGVFLFASEIKGLLAHQDLPPAPDQDALSQYLVFRYPHADRTVFEGIHSLEPGHTLTWEHGDVRIAKYWHMRFRPEDDTESPEESVEQLDHLLRDSVRIRLMSEVPLGTYCSGGVDSSLITAYAAQHHGSALNTFSVGFEDQDFDESPYARQVSNALRTTHHPLVVTEHSFTEALPKAIWLHDSPLNHPNSVPLYLLSQLAKETVTVMLSGEGSDELFGGYPRYRLVKARSATESIPITVRQLAARCLARFQGRKLKRIRESLSLPLEQVIAANAYFIDEPTAWKVGSFRGESIWKDRLSLLDTEELGRADPLGKLQYLELKTYLVSLLDRQDKMSMGAAIESRVPFLDYRIVEWSTKVSASKKIRWLQNKWIVKKLARRYLSKEVIYRSKSGFGVPIAKWLRNKNGLGRYLELLLTKQFRERGVWNHRQIERFVHEHQTGVADHSDLLWELINIELWWTLFLQTRGHEA